MFVQFSFALEVLATVLLAVMIIYAIRLNRTLVALQTDREEFEQLVAHFNDSTARAEASVARLKSSAGEIAEWLQGNVTKAQSLQDELAFMIDRANDLADRLEGAIRDARPEAPVQRGRAGKGSKSAQDAKKGKSKSALLKALEGMR